MPFYLKNHSCVRYSKLCTYLSVLVVFVLCLVKVEESFEGDREENISLRGGCVYGTKINKILQEGL